MGFSPCCKSFLCVVTIFFFSGCGKNFQKPLPICPGKSDVAESLAALKSQSEKMIPLFTNKGSFSIEYYEKINSEQQQRNENFLKNEKQV